jgi:NADH-quinone oxidoreductase subunit J
VFYLAAGAGLVVTDPSSSNPLKMARGEPGDFGRFIFQSHWLSIEIVSLLLLVAVIGALLLARRSRNLSAQESIEGEL